MAQNKPGKAQFKVLFWRKWQTEGPAKTLGSLVLAIAKASGYALLRAEKRAFDFRQPALPGTVPGPDQDLPALPPPAVMDPKSRKVVRKAPSPFALSLDRALRRSTDWREHRVWYWISGGGWKGFLGARRYWASFVRHVFDGFGRVGWTFRLVAVEPLKFATKYAAMMSTAFRDFRRFRDAGLLHRPLPTVLRRIFRSCVLPPVTGGVAMVAEAMVLDHTIGLPTALYDLAVVAGTLAIAYPIYLWLWCLEGLPPHLAGQKWPLQVEIEKIRNASPLFVGFAIPSFVHSAPGSLASCVLYTLFGSAAGQNTCSGSPLASFVSASNVIQNIPQALATVASLVSVLALFLLTVTYGYHLVQAMHTAAHTGDWTHEGVNAAWAPVRGAVSAGMIAAPGGLSILASFILFVAGTGNGLGDTAASKVANQLSAPSVAQVVPPGVQTVVDNALYSLVCEHVLDNFVDPKGSVQAVTPQADNFGGIGFSNVPGVGEYGPNVCGDYAVPSATTVAGPGMSGGGNEAFLAMVRQGSPLDSVASAIANNANGCGAVVIGTGLSPCAPAGSTPNRQVFAGTPGLTNPAGGYRGTLTQVTQNFVNSLVQAAQTNGPNGSASSPASLVQNEGWATLGGYFRFFADQARSWAQIDENLPQNIAPGGFANWSTVGSDEIRELQAAFRDTQNYIDSWGFAGTRAGAAYPFWAAVPEGESAASRMQQTVADLGAVTDPATGQTLSIPNYMANTSSDPLSKLQNVIEDADTALAVGWVGVMNPVAGRLSNALKIASEDTIDAEGSIKSLLSPITIALLVLTFVVGAYLPLIPMISIAFYMLFWIMEVAILALFAPLWALAVGIPQGDGFIGEHGRHGLARVTDIAVRPILLVGMFVLALGFYEISSNLLTVLTSEALGADKNVPTAGMWFSLAGLVGGYLVYTVILWRTIHFSFEMLHTGPYWALRILGIDGEKGREGREMEGVKEAGGWIVQNVKTTLSGFKINPKG
ncbi:DotA/TraY family protein [Leptospirillum ferriphilum]|uniref:DotA/TraY family protein n=1 Tax=Leptospirillum ferriphilum TaxID=178606 RepID=UPI0006B1B0D9|nr:DotA/TraY family protein [Leptospirillum ferriphilum]